MKFHNKNGFKIGYLWDKDIKIKIMLSQLIFIINHMVQLPGDHLQHQQIGIKLHKDVEMLF
jgi:hypothetical protein